MPKLQITVDEKLKEQLDQYCSARKVSKSKLASTLFEIFLNNALKNEKKRLEQKDELKRR